MLFPILFRRRVLPGDFARYEAFRDVSCFQVKMSVNRADFAGDIKPRNRFLHRIKDALFDVVLGSALSVIHDRPSFDDVERRILDRHHRFWRAFVIVVLASFTELAPTFDDSVQHF